MTTSVVPGEVLLDRLGQGCQRRGLVGLAGRLGALSRLVGGDLAECELALASAAAGLDEADRPAAAAGTVVQRSAAHLLARGGKRLRPLCVLLAARVGRGFSPAVRELAVAVELVHAATLLHDDVVDVGDMRRGAPAARTLYGNAASIFAGDWLLVAALRRVRRAAIPGVLDRLLSVIEEMIAAEAEQLERRGTVSADRASYFRVIEGKTAALFRWAMWAGARAGELPPHACAALESFGQHLGVAFQAVDDLLDLAGDPERTGKALFADLREGKMTFPVIVALERDPSLRELLEQVCRDPAAAPELGLEARRRVERTGAEEACRSLAREHVGRALSALAALPPGEAVEVLADVATATVSRDR